jgi:hypothetical protein
MELDDERKECFHVGEFADSAWWNGDVLCDGKEVKERMSDARCTMKARILQGYQHCQHRHESPLKCVI